MAYVLRKIGWLGCLLALAFSLGSCSSSYKHASQKSPAKRKMVPCNCPPFGYNMPSEEVYVDYKI